jgi:hypothetical protein
MASILNFAITCIIFYTHVSNVTRRGARVQFEARSVVMTAVTDYIWIVRLQHRWIRNHPRSAAVTKAAAAAKAVEVKANKKGKMGKKIKPDKKLNKKRSME